MIVTPYEQGTEEWSNERLGTQSASNFKKIVTSTGKPSTSATGYFYELLGERLTGEPASNFKNEWMQRGNELEPKARSAYEFITDNGVELIGFCLLNDRSAGCSPDGLVGGDGLIEIKCPKASTHAKYLLDNKVPSEYVPQVQGQLWIMEREWCDFVSYHPKCDPLIIRVNRDDRFIDALKVEVKKLADKLDKATSQLMGHRQE